MKISSNIIYFFGLFLLLLLIFIYENNRPKEFNWNPTFSKYDRQPFGSYVFDDVVTASVNKYEVVNLTFGQLFWEYERPIENYSKDDDSNIIPLPFDARESFILIENRLDFSSYEVNDLMKLIKQGNKILLCSHYFSNELCKKLGFSVQYDNNFSSTISGFARVKSIREKLYFGVDSLKPEKIYDAYPSLSPIFFKEISNSVWHSKKDASISYDKYEIFVRNQNGNPVAMRFFIGEGELFFVATPLMFTNYGILDGENASYAFRLLSYLKDLPISRIEAYNNLVNQASTSPLRYFLEQPPLRWALYFSLITIVVCMFFSAKRKQRIIPVVNSPKNETLSFTKLIGNLYYQQKNYKEMLLKKELYFSTEVKRLTGIDLNSDENEDELCRRLSDKIGKHIKEVKPSFRALMFRKKENIAVDEKTMMQLIDKMNEWLKYLYN